MNYIKISYECIDTLLNFIFPRNIYCILCGRPIDRDEEYSICHKCKLKLKFIGGKTCNKCGKPINDLYIDEICHECISNLHFFTKAISCIEYDDLSKKIIYDLKYNKKRYIAYHIAEIIYDRLVDEKINSIDMIIPVPLHPAKERARSFNQVNIIGRHLSRMANIDLDNKTLIRSKHTITQNKLTKEERRKNLEDAFKVAKRNGIINKNILIIDDIYTTGATINQCSRVLIENGAQNIYAATFATGRNDCW
ncbi:ComF family protein [Maledivibacter halophilus]|uniref:ComF family protein n=1 Tax=Maledivibacter halophilus TaxID=36842 RepID=A0A1T5JWY7_9FIRM|nr:ComF family protein [Maledivibacter halophilus]SKC55931.1 comF family protein [Maledivibacter halophilus]